MAQVKHNAFIHAGGVGDFLLACPALAAWRPVGHLALLGMPDRLELAVHAGLADTAHSLESVDFHTLFSYPSDRCKAFFAEMQEVLVWMRDDDGQLENALLTCGVGRVRCFPGVPPDSWEQHAAQYYATCLGVNHDPAFRLNIAPAGTATDIIIHPGSGSQKKNWPLANYCDLTRHLQAQNRTVSWVLGPAEEGITPPPGVDLLCPTLLAQLAATLTQTRLYIGNDSGVSHLAGILGTPCLAIFGPTNPAVWAPLGKRSRVVHGNPWPDVDGALSALEEIPQS